MSSQVEPLSALSSGAGLWPLILAFFGAMWDRSSPGTVAASSGKGEVVIVERPRIDTEGTGASADYLAPLLSKIDFGKVRESD